MVLARFCFDFAQSAQSLVVGIPMVVWGLGFSLFAWIRSIPSGDEASAGAVMLAGLPFIVGISFLLHAASYEMLGSSNHRVSGTPRKP
jgi:hypothetical protein